MLRNLPKLPLVRFHRRIPIIPGLLWLNIFKWGVSISIGQQGFRITLGKSNIRGTIGLTGSGIYLTKNINHSASDIIKKTLSSEKSSEIKHQSNDEN